MTASGTREGTGHSRLWNLFGLGRDSFYVMPRVLMHAMPDEWQGQMADLLEEYEATFETYKLPSCRVMAVSPGARPTFSKWPEWLLCYRHPDKSAIDAFRSVLSTEGRE